MTLLLLSALAFGQDSYIVGGAETSDYPATAGLKVGGRTCSGTLIAPEYLLTAAHCLANLNDDKVRNSYAVFGTSLNDQQDAIDKVKFEEVIGFHPDWDVVLIRLVRPVVGVQPAMVYGGDLNPIWTSRTATLVGFGYTGDDRKGLGVKRVVQGVRTAQIRHPYLLIYEPGRNLCGGDSGGSTYLPTKDGDVALVGVNAFVFHPSNGSKMCDEGGGGSVRVDTLVPWLLDITPLDMYFDDRSWDPDEAETWAGSNQSEVVAVDLPELPAPGGCQSSPVQGWWAMPLALIGMRRRRA